MANAFFAELNNVDVCECPNFNDDEKECIAQHLILSSNIKHLWTYGDALLEGIFNCKRRRKRLLRNPLLRRLARIIRKLAKYELLRSCLEGLLFDQVCNHDEPFGLIGIEENNVFLLTHIYFSTHTWDRKIKYNKEIEFDKCDNVTTLDYMKILHYIECVNDVMNDIAKYVRELDGVDLKWKKRIIRSAQMIKKTQRSIVPLLNETPGPQDLIID